MSPDEATRQIARLLAERYVEARRKGATDTEAVAACRLLWLDALGLAGLNTRRSRATFAERAANPSEYLPPVPEPMPGDTYAAGGMRHDDGLPGGRPFLDEGADDPT